MCDINLTIAYTLAWMGLTGCLFIIIAHGGRGVRAAWRDFWHDVEEQRSTDFIDE